MFHDFFRPTTTYIYIWYRYIFRIDFLEDDRSSNGSSNFPVVGKNVNDLTNSATAVSPTNGVGGTSNGNTTDLVKVDALTPKQRNQMKHRELFLSRQVETLPATHIRGKCSVTLLNETESMISYLNKAVSQKPIYLFVICKMHGIR